MLAQYLPWTIGVPLGVLLVLAAALQLWKLNHPTQQQLLIRLPLKRVVASTFILVAIIAIGAVVYLLLNTEHVKESEPAPTPPSTSSLTWQWSHPSPQEIFSDINAYPPYRQDTIRQDYTGLPVIWGVTLFSTTESADGLRIYALPSGQSNLGVIFTIDTTLYPQIKTMPKGQEFVVQGTITEVTSLWIALGDCHLFFY
jgi:hypothetical protein